MVQNQKKETQVSNVPSSVGYSNNGGYTMNKAEYYRYLESIGKRIERTPNGVIIH
jgi:hypothetical protein